MSADTGSWWVDVPRERWREAVAARQADLRRLTADGRLISTAHLHQLTRRQRARVTALEDEDL